MNPSISQRLVAVASTLAITAAGLTAAETPTTAAAGPVVAPHALFKRALAAPRVPVTTPISVYFVPHPDDEVISMGALITKDVQARRTVYVVMATDGADSGSRHTLCESSKGAYCLTPQAMGSARQDEFVRATMALGVPRTNIVKGTLRGSGLTVGGSNDVLALETSWMNRFGNRATYTTMSWLDRHPDHQALGIGLDRLCQQRGFTTCRFAVSPLYLPGTGLTRVGGVPILPAFRTVTDRTGRLRNAVGQYRVFDPSRGMFGFGGRWSVPAQLMRVFNVSSSTVHSDSRTYASADAKRQSLAWAAKTSKPSPPPALAQELFAIDGAGRLAAFTPLGRFAGPFRVANASGRGGIAPDALKQASWIDASRDVNGDQRPDVLYLRRDRTLVAQLSSGNGAYAAPIILKNVGASQPVFTARRNDGVGVYLRDANGSLTLLRVTRRVTVDQVTALGGDWREATSFVVRNAAPGTVISYTVADGHVKSVPLSGTGLPVGRAMPAATLAPGSRLISAGTYYGNAADDVVVASGGRYLVWRAIPGGKLAELSPVTDLRGRRVIG